jgi:hypothetical protein
MVDGYKVPIKDLEGKVTGLQCVFWDVTKHERFPRGEMIDIAIGDMRSSMEGLNKQIRRLEAMIAHDGSAGEGKRVGAVAPKSVDCVKVLVVMGTNPNVPWQNADIKIELNKVREENNWFSDDDVYHLLKFLREDGFVEKQGQTAGTRWMLSERGKAWLVARQDGGQLTQAQS